MTIFGSVGGKESSRHLSRCRGGERTIRHINAQFKPLAQIAAFGDAGELLIRRRNAIGIQLRHGLSLKPVIGGADVGQHCRICALQNCQRRLGEFVARFGDQKPHRRRDTGMQRRNHILGRNQLTQGHPMQGSCPAKGHQAIAARVNAARHRVGGDGQGHGVIDDLQHAQGRILDAHAKGRGQLVTDCGLGQGGVNLQPAAKEMFRVQPAQHHLGVGHRRVLAAAPIAGWPRLCPGRPGSHTEGPATVDIGDRPATRADGVNVDHGRQHRHMGHLGVTRVLDGQFPTPDHADIS